MMSNKNLSRGRQKGQSFTMRRNYTQQYDWRAKGLEKADQIGNGLYGCPVAIIRIISCIQRSYNSLQH